MRRHADDAYGVVADGSYGACDVRPVAHVVHRVVVVAHEVPARHSAACDVRVIVVDACVDDSDNDARRSAGELPRACSVGVVQPVQVAEALPPRALAVVERVVRGSAVAFDEGLELLNPLLAELRILVLGGHDAVVADKLDAVGALEALHPRLEVKGVVDVHHIPVVELMLIRGGGDLPVLLAREHLVEPVHAQEACDSVSLGVVAHSDCVIELHEELAGHVLGRSALLRRSGIAARSGESHRASCRGHENPLPRLAHVVVLLDGAVEDRIHLAAQCLIVACHVVPPYTFCVH